MFARLGPGVVIDRPDSGIYRFRGGHRLWAAPEVPSITYAPDDEACAVTEMTGDVTGVNTLGRPDRAGLAKGIDVIADDGSLLVDHVLTNAGSEPIQVAPWAITQLRLGGTAIIPIDGKTDPDRLQANASLVLWPYTDLGDPRVTWRQGGLMVRAEAGPAYGGLEASLLPDAGYHTAYRLTLGIRPSFGHTRADLRLDYRLAGLGGVGHGLQALAKRRVDLLAHQRQLHRPLHSAGAARRPTPIGMPEPPEAEAEQDDAEDDAQDPRDVGSHL